MHGMTPTLDLTTRFADLLAGYQALEPAAES